MGNRRKTGAAGSRWWRGWYGVLLGLSLLACQGESPRTEPPGPRLGVSPEALDYGAMVQELPLRVENRGGRVLDWSVTPGEEWVTVAPASGETRDAEEILVRVERGALPNGSHDGLLEVTSNAGQLQVPVSLLVSPLLRADPDVLAFDEMTDVLDLTLRNEGYGSLAWALSPADDWFDVTPREGTTTETVTVTATVDRSRLGPGQTESVLRISSNGGDLALPVRVQEPSEARLYPTDDGRLRAEAPAADTDWTRRLSETSTEWNHAFEAPGRVGRILFHLVLSSNQQPVELTVQATLTRGGDEVWAKGVNISLEAQYPQAVRRSVDLDETPVAEGDELRLEVHSVGDAWLFQGGDPTRTSYLALE